MRFAVVVRSAQEFQNWAALMQREAAPPEAVAGDAAAGRELFLAPTSQCIGCHSVSGTTAVGVTGPNLTHVASRGFIAGGVLANSPENLRAWVTNAPGFKPGTVMPSFANVFTPEQVNDLVAYLTSLH
jgi:cytochrome c oxidase subunit 2